MSEILGADYKKLKNKLECPGCSSAPMSGDPLPQPARSARGLPSSTLVSLDVCHAADFPSHLCPPERGSKVARAHHESPEPAFFK